MVNQYTKTAFFNEVLSHFDMPEEVELRPIQVGLIHQTYILSIDGTDQWVIQGLHPKLSNDEILADFEAVTTHLSDVDYGGPRLVKTKNGELAARHDNQRWRLSTYVPGETFTEVNSPSLAFQGGAGLAHFHRAIGTIQYAFQSSHLGHKTHVHLQRLIDASQKTIYASAWSDIARHAEEIISELSSILLPEELPRQVVHGDPKISNLRFHNDKAIMIDLDTCAYHTRLVDLGDAVRSWCHTPQAPVGERFNISYYQSMISGYLSEGTAFTDLERAWLPHAGRTITLELASRFALDYLEDHYFAFDQQRFSSRRAHNLHRIRQMKQLAQEMKEATPQLENWLDEMI